MFLKPNRDHDAGTGRGFVVSSQSLGSLVQQQSALINESHAFGCTASLESDEIIDDEVDTYVMRCDIELPVQNYQKVYIESVTGICQVQNTNTGIWYDIDQIVGVRAFPFFIPLQPTNPQGATITAGNSNVIYSFLKNSQKWERLYYATQPTITLAFIIPKGSFPFTPDAVNTARLGVSFTAMFKYEG